MAVATLLTEGFANGTFSGTVALLVRDGFGAGAVTVPDAGSLDYAVSGRLGHFLAPGRQHHAAVDSRKFHAEAIDQ